MSGLMPVLLAVRELHHDAPKYRCGARKTMTVEHQFSGSVSETELVCTNDPGHAGKHKDAICCWRFHEFDDAEPQIEDAWRGEACSCGTMNCKTRALLDEAGIPDHPETPGEPKENQ